MSTARPLQWYCPQVCSRYPLANVASGKRCFTTANIASQPVPVAPGVKAGGGGGGGGGAGFGGRGFGTAGGGGGGGGGVVITGGGGGGGGGSVKFRPPSGLQTVVSQMCTGRSVGLVNSAGFSVGAWAGGGFLKNISPLAETVARNAATAALTLSWTGLLRCLPPMSTPYLENFANSRSCLAKSAEIGRPSRNHSGF